MTNRDGWEDNRCVGHHQRVHLWSGWWWWWWRMSVMVPAHCYDDTTNVQTNPWEVRHPASKHSSKGVTDPDNLQIIYKWTFQWKNDQHYRHKERSICNWDSSDYGHVGEVDKGGVEPDHGEGVGDANEEEEGVRQQLEVHHLLENSEHPSVWGGGKELGDQVSSSLTFFRKSCRCLSITEHTQSPGNVKLWGLFSLSFGLLLYWHWTVVLNSWDDLRDPADEPTGSPSAEFTRLPLRKGSSIHTFDKVNLWILYFIGQPVNADKALLVGAKALLHRDVTRVWSQARSLQIGKTKIRKSAAGLE